VSDATRAKAASSSSSFVFKGPLTACLAVSSALALVPARAKAPEIYAPPDYVNWRRTTEAVLNYPIPGHMDRFRIPRMSDLGFSTVPKLVGGLLAWAFPRTR
jgi:hypothetical protein